jgi:hypothetical protein
VARLQFLKKYNGTKIEVWERKDFEIYYMKFAYETFLRQKQAKKPEGDQEQALNVYTKDDVFNDPEIISYMEEFHPRFF